MRAMRPLSTLAALAAAALVTSSAPAAAGTARALLPDSFRLVGAAPGRAGGVLLAGGRGSDAGVALVDSDGGFRLSRSTGGPVVAAGAAVDGDAWFTDSSTSIGHITPSGWVTHIATNLGLPAGQTFGAIFVGAPATSGSTPVGGRIGELAADGSLVQVLQPGADPTRRLLAADPSDHSGSSRRAGRR